MKSIFDPSFRYTPSYETNVRKTFERIRREQSGNTRDTVSPLKPGREKVLPMRVRQEARK
jgi:hypothetical protein